MTALSVPYVSVGGTLTAPGRSTFGSFVYGLTEPTASNAGVLDEGATFTTVNAGNTITYSTPQNHTRKRFTSFVKLDAGADGSTFTDCIFNGAATDSFVSQYGLVESQAGATATFTRCLFESTNPRYWILGFKGNGVTFDRCEFRNVVDGMQVMSGAKVTVRGSYFHDLTFRDDSTDQQNDATHPFWTHNDCIQLRGGGTVEATGNAFWGRASQTTGMPATLAANGFPRYMRPTGVTISPATPVNGLLVTKNWFYGGEACFQMNQVNPSGSQAVGELSYNRFSRDAATKPHDFGSGSYYYIRYKSGLSFTGLSTNYFMDAPGTGFVESFTGGIRVDP